MKNSSHRILTTHTGSLPRPADLVAALNAKEMGEPYDSKVLSERVERAFSEIVTKQCKTGIDVVNDGEHSKVSWMAFVRGRLDGLEEIDGPVRFRGATRDSIAFPETYEDMKLCWPPGLRQLLLNVRSDQRHTSAPVRSDMSAKRNDSAILTISKRL